MLAIFPLLRRFTTAGADHSLRSSYMHNQGNNQQLSLHCLIWKTIFMMTRLFVQLLRIRDRLIHWRIPSSLVITYLAYNYRFFGPHKYVINEVLLYHLSMYYQGTAHQNGNQIPSERKRISLCCWDPRFRSDGNSFWPGIRSDGILFWNWIYLWDLLCKLCFT